MNPEPPTPSFPDDFETRLTALLLGELSGAEAEEVRRAVAADPALQVLQERLAQTIGLVRDAIGIPAASAAATATAAPAPVRPKLSEERRERLLARLRQPAGTATPAVDSKTVSMPAPEHRQSARRWSIPWYLPMSLAAAVVVLLTLNPLMDGLAPRPMLAMSPAANRHYFFRENAATGVEANDLALNAPVAPPSAPAPLEDLAQKDRTDGRLEASPKQPTPDIQLFGTLDRPAKPASAAASESKQEATFERKLSVQVDQSARSRSKGKALADVAGGKADLSESMARTPRNAVRAVGGTPPSDDGRVQQGLGFGGGAASGSFNRGIGGSTRGGVAGAGGVASYGGGGNASTVGRELKEVTAESIAVPAFDSEAPPSPAAPQTALARRLGRPAAAFVEEQAAALGQQVAPPSSGLGIANGAAKAEWFFDTDAKDTKSSALKQRGTQAGLEGAEKPAGPPAIAAYRFALGNDKRGEAVSTADRLQEAEVESVQLLRKEPEVRFGVPADNALNRDVADKALREQATQYFAKVDPAPAQALPAIVAGTAVASSSFGDTVDGTRNPQAPATVAPVDSNGRYIKLGKEFRNEIELKERVEEGRVAARRDFESRSKAPAESKPTQMAGEPATATNHAGATPEMLGKRVALSAAVAAPIPAPAPDTKVLALPASDDALAAVAPRTPTPVPQPEVTAADNAFSTFSLNVTDVSFKLAAASLEKGVLPDPATIRTEEFINAFHYRDAEPAAGVPVGFAWERSQYPFAHNRELLRFAVRTSATGRDATRPLNLVLLLDNSGSMERADRVRIVREALRVLSAQLKPEDRISVVTFARQPRLWIDAAAGNEAGDLADRVGSLTPEGGTNLEEAMNLAYDTAARHFLAQGVNRVVLLTDGAANLGDVSAASLKGKVETWRKRGVALDCFGIGWEGLNDELLEALARNGDGRYGFVNTPEEASTGFAAQLAGALNVAAADVKVQVEFNPQRVTTWRQLGYAKHQLKKEQFRDNTVDAAELAAAESGNALYTAEVNANGSGPIATVRVRFREPATGTYREHAWEVPYSGAAVALDRAPARMRLAAVGSAFSEWLAGSPFAAEVEPGRLLNLLQGVSDEFGPDPAPQKLESMIRQARSLTGK